MSDLKLTITGWGNVLVDTREMKALMRGAGNDVKSKTAKLINASNGGGRLTHYKGQGGAYRASLPGNPPVRASGALRSSLKVYPYKSGMGFAVRARQFYALFLESGARGGGNPFGGRSAAAAEWRAQHRRRRARGRYTVRVLEPRPFLDKVMTQEAPELERRLSTAMRQALKWRETKR